MTHHLLHIPEEQSLLVRLSESGRERVQFVLDGRVVEAMQGDTVLTAILTQQSHLRMSDLGGEPRAGFCLMGACQDCWVTLITGQRIRACSTFVAPGLNVLTGSESTK
jgi:predicted molibdopterin-dependent oxidoreductase YjgC